MWATPFAGLFRTGEEETWIASVGLVDIELSTWALDVGEGEVLFSPRWDRERFTLLFGRGGGGGGVDDDEGADSVSADDEFNLSSKLDVLINATSLPPPGKIFSLERGVVDPLFSRFSLLPPSPQLAALSPNALAMPHKPRRRGGSGGGAFPCRNGSMLLLDDSTIGVDVDAAVAVEPEDEVRDGEAGGVGKITSSSQTFSTIPVRINDQSVQVALSRARHQPDVQRG